MKIKFNLAFTLAEVLITLGTIGIVAVLVIPPLVNDGERIQTLGGLKKGYADLTQFFKAYITDQKVDNLAQTRIFDNQLDYNELAKVVNYYFKVVTECPINNDSCQISGRDLKGASNAEFSGGNYYVFSTAEGMRFAIRLEPKEACNPVIPPPGKIKGVCMEIEMDINGVKSPNRTGRDFYDGIFVGNDGVLYPKYGQAWVEYNTSDPLWGGNSGVNHCGMPGVKGVPSTATGEGCLARIIEDGWDMKY